MTPYDIYDLTSGETSYCRNRPGDLLVWSMRMTHSGAGTLLKDPDARYPEPSEWNAFPPDEVAPAHDERMAVFVHLGANDKHGRRYLDYLKTRTCIVDSWRSRPFTPEVVDTLTSAGPVVRDMPAEVKDGPRAGLSEVWEPYWYPGKVQPVPQQAATPATPPAAPTPPPAPPAPRRDPFLNRYGRATKRRLRGVIGGARQGWHDAAPKAKRAGAAK